MSNSIQIFRNGKKILKARRGSQFGLAGSTLAQNNIYNDKQKKAFSTWMDDSIRNALGTNYDESRADEYRNQFKYKYAKWQTDNFGSSVSREVDSLGRSYINVPGYDYNRKAEKNFSIQPEDFDYLNKVDIKDIDTGIDQTPSSTPATTQSSVTNFTRGNWAYDSASKRPYVTSYGQNYSTDFDGTPYKTVNFSSAYEANAKYMKAHPEYQKYFDIKYLTAPMVAHLQRDLYRGNKNSITGIIDDNFFSELKNRYGSTFN